MYIPKFSNTTFKVLGLLVATSMCQLLADSPDKSFVMRATEPIIVENTLLSAGTHVWKLMDSPSNRHIVQITDQKDRHVEAIIVAIPNYRAVTTETNEVVFWETPSGLPRAVRAWFCPGDNYGQEFPYPEQMMASFHSLVPSPVLGGNTTAVAEEPAKRVEPTVAASASDSKTTEQTAQATSAQATGGSWAVITNGPPAAPSKPARHSTGLWNAIKHLPLTATLAPLIGLIGAGFLLLFVMSHAKRNKQQNASL
jgi:hypothetical protein